jgi:hypothetical protein
MEIKQKIIEALNEGNIIWRKHSVERMLQRNISRDVVIRSIVNGEIIKSYYDDKPFPSFLILHYNDETPLHVVVSYYEAEKFVYIITVYNPSDDYYEEDHKTRRK